MRHIMVIFLGGIDGYSIMDHITLVNGLINELFSWLLVVGYFMRE